MPAQTRRSNQINRILLVVDYCHAGDALRIAPYVRAVRECYPRATVTLLANAHTIPVFQVGEHFDRVIVSRLYDAPTEPSWRARLSQAGEFLRLAMKIGTGYDLVLTFWWGTPPLHLLGWLAAPFGSRVGYARKLPWLLTSRLGHMPGIDPPAEHLVMLREAGVVTRRMPPNIPFSDADAVVVADVLQQEGLGERAFVIMHPGSDWACQQWVPANWAALADEVATRYGVDIAFTGIPREAALIENIRCQMRAPSVSLVGRTSLRQLASLLSRACLCVSVDSAVYELSQAVGIPAVVLAGPTDPQLVVPGIRLPVIVNPLSAEERRDINECRQVHDGDGGCLNYQCHMAGLRQISLSQALQAIERQAGQARLVEQPTEEVQWAQ